MRQINENMSRRLDVDLKEQKQEVNYDYHHLTNYKVSKKESKPWDHYDVNINSLSRIMSSIIKYSLIVYHLDLLVVYKNSKLLEVGFDEKQKNRIYRLPELIINEVTTLDKVSYRIHRVFIKYVSILCIKFFLLCSIQIINSNSNYSKMKSIQDLKTTINNDNNYDSLNITYNVDYKTLHDYAFELGLIIGNPLVFIIGVSIFLYSSLTIGLFNSVWLLAKVFRRGSIDVAHARLFIDPRREMYRIDKQIEEKLNDYLVIINSNSRFIYNSNGIFDNNYNNSLIRRRRIGNKKDILINMTSFQRRDFYVKIINLLKTRLFIMRPYIYTNEYYPNIAIHMSIVSFFILLCTTLPLFFAPKSLLNATKFSKCEYIGLKDVNCNFDILTWNEYLTLLEILLGVVMIGYSLIIQIYAMVGQTISHLNIIKDIKLDLDLCIYKLRKYNESSIYDDFNIVDYFNSINKSTINLKQDNYKLTMEVLNQQPKYKSARETILFDIETSLIKNLVKISITSDDIRRNATAISTVLRYFIFTVGFCLVLALIGGELEDSYLNVTRNSMLIWLIYMTNTILIICCSHFARTCDLDAKIFSIISQLIRMSMIDHDSNTYFDTFIGSSWLKVAHNYMFSDTKNIIRFMSFIHIKYSRVMEFNFILLSISALLKTI